jgi:hypothetical protein
VSWIGLAFYCLRVLRQVRRTSVKKVAKTSCARQKKRLWAPKIVARKLLRAAPRREGKNR